MNTRVWRQWVVCLGLVLAVGLGALWVSGCGRSSDTGAPPATTAARTTSTPSEVDFRSASKLRGHYEKHGREFGDITQNEYLQKAKALRDAPLSESVIEQVRADRTVTRFDRDSGSFIAFEASGVIRTFFRPNDGEAYFRRQARR